MSATIRPETVADHGAIRQVHRRAFGQEAEAAIVDGLRSGGFARASLVAEVDGVVVGHILFSELPILTDGGVVPALSLAPMSVAPECQRRGVGSALVREGLARCRAQGHRIVVVLGHAHFYARFGFSATVAERLASPFGGGDSWRALELTPGALDGISGWVRYPPPFSSKVHVRPVYQPDRVEWLRMRAALWPDDGVYAHAEAIAAFFSTGQFEYAEAFLACRTFVAERPDQRLCGFVEASIRSQVDGCAAGPVGYIEGWHVDPDMRRQGIGRRLIEAAERWATANGCRELASDARLDNSLGALAHRSLGFEESDRLIHFRKPLPEASAGRSTPPGNRHQRLLVVDGSFAVCKLPRAAPIPDWATNGDLFSVTRTGDELSVVCRETDVPDGVHCQGDWRCLRVAGTMPFDLVGVLASLTAPVANAGVGVFAISTFDTDYLLVPANALAKAVKALQSAGHQVDDGRPVD